MICSPGRGVAGVGQIVNVGTNLETSRAAIDLAEAEG